MQTQSYKTCRDLWCDLCGLDIATLENTTKALFNRAFNRAMRRAWDWYFWPELCLLEQRFYRDAYSAATAYAAPTASASSEAWYAPAGRYFQTLQATTNNVPATVVAGVWVANGPYWADSSASYGGNDWAASTAYTAATSSAAGTIVRNPIDGRYYMCHTAHTSGVSFDSTKFGILTNFDPYVGYEQTSQTAFSVVRNVWNGNFRTTRPAARLPWEYDERGVRLTGTVVPSSVSVQFRKRCPSWKGSDWSNGVLATGITRYYSSTTDGFDGDFYTTLSATLAADSPEVAPTKWTKIQIPSFLSDFAVNAAKIAQLEGDGELEKALGDTKGELWTYLYDEMDKLEGQSGQARTARVANI